MNRSTFSGILTAVFLSILCIPCAAGVSAEAKTGFSDVDKENPFYEEIRLCCEAGLMEPLEADRFGPEEPLNKGDLVRLAARLYSLSGGGDGSIPPLPEDLGTCVRFYDKGGRLVHDAFSPSTLDLIVTAPQALTAHFYGEPLSQEALAMEIGFPGDETVCAGTGVRAGYDEEYGFTKYLFTFPEGVDLPKIDPQEFQEFCHELRSALEVNRREGLDDPSPYDAALYLCYRTPDRLPFCYRTMSLDSMPYLSVWRMELAIPLAELCKDLPEVRTVDSIPDLPDNYRFQNSETEAVLSLYRRGILQGFDGAGTFGGAEWLTRGQAAAMAARFLEASLRAA